MKMINNWYLLAVGTIHGRAIAAQAIISKLPISNRLSIVKLFGSPPPIMCVCVLVLDEIKRCVSLNIENRHYHR